jgi:hypothetical protein
VKGLNPFLLAVTITAVLVGTIRPSFAAVQCRPYGEFGQTGVLGNFYGAGLQCSSDNSSFFLGTRSTQAGGGLFSPVVGLTYAIAPSEGLTFKIKADIREHIGDYEVNSLPELSLAWTSPHRDGAVQFTLGAVWGSYMPTTITAPIQRTELLATAAFPKWQLAPTVNAQVSVTGGYATYSTSDMQSWIETDMATWGNLGPAIDWNVTFGAKASSGVSPLKFDNWSGGNVQASPSLTFHLDSQWAVSIRGTWSFQSATLSSLSYDVRTTILGPVLTFGYDPMGQTLTGTYDIPNLGNIGIRYDQPHSIVYAVFEPH